MQLLSGYLRYSMWILLRAILIDYPTGITFEIAKTTEPEFIFFVEKWSVQVGNSVRFQMCKQLFNVIDFDLHNDGIIAAFAGYDIHLFGRGYANFDAWFCFEVAVVKVVLEKFSNLEPEDISVPGV